MVQQSSSCRLHVSLCIWFPLLHGLYLTLLDPVLHVSSRSDHFHQHLSTHIGVVISCGPCNNVSVSAPERLYLRSARVNGGVHHGVQPLAVTATDYIYTLPEVPRVDSA